MAGNVTGLHRFADDVGPVPLSLLDTNFDALTLAINTLNTYSNFYVDTGTTNALTITPPSTQSVSYSDGLVVSVRVAATNTGASTLNIGTLGPQPIQSSTGTALTGGELQAGSITEFVYNASRNAWQLKPGGGGGGGGGSGGGPFTTPFIVNSTSGQALMEVYTPAATAPAGQGIFEVTGPAVQGPSGYLANFYYSAPPTAGNGSGVWIAGGTNASDVAFQVFNAAHTLTAPGVSFFQIRGDGSGSLGAYPNQLIWNTAGQFSLTGTASLPGGGGGTGGVSYLSQLLDVSLTSQTQGQALTWNSSTSRWTNTTITTALSGLTDVQLSGQANGQVLAWNSATSRWTNQAAASGSLAGLTDVTLTSPTSGQFLSYNGTRWVNVAAPSGGVGGTATTPFTVNDTAGQAVFKVLDGSAAQASFTGVVTIGPGNATDNTLILALNGATNYDVMDVAGAPHTTAGHWLSKFTAASGVAAGMSNGILINAGTNSSDLAFEVQNTSASTTYFVIRGDGTGALGASANNMTWTTSGFTFTSNNPAVNPITVVVPPSTTAGNWLWRIGGPGASGDSPGCSNALVVAGGTNASDYALLVQNDGSTKTFLSLKGDGSGAIGPSPNQLVWSTTGAFTLTGTATLPGGSGGTLTPPVTLAGASNQNVFAVSRSAANTAGGFWLGTFTGQTTGAGFSNGVYIAAGTNASDNAFQVLPASSSFPYLNIRGDGLSVYRYTPFSAQGSWMMQLGGGTTGNATNCSNGLYVGAGTSVNDCALWVQSDAATPATFLQILGTGAVYMPAVGTTATAANVVMDSNHQVLTSTSVARVKSDIRSVSRLRARETVRRLRAVSYHSRCAADDPSRTHYGLIAEEVAEIDPNLVTWDSEGNPQGVQYERIAMLLLPLMQELLA